MIALGEYPLENWDADNHWNIPLLMIFCIGTFFVEITMLNMLIAIMSDTFGKVYAQKEVKANKARLKFVSEMESKRILLRLFRCCGCAKAHQREHD